MEYEIVERDNPLALHGIFDTLASAQRHLTETIPCYVARGYFVDKTLAAADFVIRERSKGKHK